ncbi:hypothetical protein EDM59_20110 [Brevibacillus nitrificans]|uniref:Uncharacterized protein n=1 Tax=Brevibacillus nitrificans TaxID=651560 RepID=A0A3M8D4U9_9BACL|nr:hypothetical protein EDM59_20110 [Brevibacillus nitrificans]
MIHQGECPQSNEFEQYVIILQEFKYDEKSFDKSSYKVTSLMIHETIYFRNKKSLLSRHSEWELPPPAYYRVNIHSYPCSL